MKEYPPESQEEVEQEYEPDEEWMNAPLGTPDGFREPKDMPKSVKTDLF